MPTPVPLIIDCDPGIDDALALFLAAASPDQLQLLAVTCVAGNRPVATTTANACRLLDAAGRPDVPVYAGAAHPLGQHEPRCNLVHGEDGLGGVTLPLLRTPLPAPAADVLTGLLLQAPPRHITVVAIGPLTNLATAELKHPGLLRRAKALLVMGGAVACPGNVTPLAEFNFYADPSAARIVIESGAEIGLFGLDVTGKAVMSAEWIESLLTIDRRCAKLSHAMLTAYAQQDPLLHDACPVAYLLRPHLFEGAAWSLAVDETPGPQAGHVRAHPIHADGEHHAAAGDPAGKPLGAAARVYFDVDRAGLMALVRSRLENLP